MPITVAATRQLLADAYKNAAGSGTAWMSLHSTDPGSTGAAEASGGTPAYARKQVTWTSGTGGVLTAANVTFDVDPDAYAYVGYWTAATGGTFVNGGPLNPSMTIAGQGTITVTPSYTQS